MKINAIRDWLNSGTGKLRQARRSFEAIKILKLETDVSSYIILRGKLRLCIQMDGRGRREAEKGIVESVSRAIGLAGGIVLKARDGPLKPMLCSAETSTGTVTNPL